MQKYCYEKALVEPRTNDQNRRNLEAGSWKRCVCNISRQESGYASTSVVGWLSVIELLTKITIILVALRDFKTPKTS